MNGQPLTLYEREKIQFGLRTHESIREMARELKRNHSIICREIKNNSGSDGTYRANEAHAKSLKRRMKKRKRKLDTDDALRNYVISKLMEELSPNVIAGILKNRLEPLMIGKGISHETIYQYIHEGQGRFMGLYQYLVRKHKKRLKQKSIKSRKHGQIQYTTPIILRPVEINKRSLFGDWESDTVECQEGNLSVQIERMTRLVRIHKIKTKHAEETYHALIKTFESLPANSIHSITFDNGTEGAHHWKLRHEYGIETYFCKSYSSWQKGSVEHVNGILRRYFPRKMNLNQISDYEIYLIQEKINNRPRKILNFKSPNQLAKEILKNKVVL